MPRIRSIKPEFWTSGQVLECSTNARLLFIGLWNFCDDQGRHALRAKQIKAEVFPADDFTADDILGMIDELASNDLITLYEHESQQFLQVNGWHHQRIDKPQAPKFPDPFDEHSTIIRGTLPPDRKGEDRKDIYVPPKGETQTPFSEIVALYHQHCPSLAQVAKLTPARQEQIRARWRNELPTLEQWAEYFQAVEASDFLTGRVPPSGGRQKPWKADIDFLIKQGNVVKMAEGKYD